MVDESGSALPGVTVTATHTDTGTSRTTVTSTTGVFLMPALPIGRFRLQLELTGFNTVVQENFQLEVGQSAMLSFTMKIATLQETITVAGESPLVETQKSELAGRVSATQVENLPLNGRNWLDLVALVPGARGNPGTIRAGFAGRDMARYQVDGVDVSGQCCGGSNQGYSQENIQEFEVITNRYDAEYRPRGGRGDQRRHQVGDEPVSRNGLWLSARQRSRRREELHHPQGRDISREADRSQRRRSDLARSRLLLRELRIPVTRRDRDSAHWFQQVRRGGEQRDRPALHDVPR